MFETFIESGFLIPEEPVFLNDEEYSKAISALVFVCSDTLPICNGRIFLAKRRAKPLSGCWWVIGGRMLFGETSQQAAARCFNRETKLDLSLSRFKKFGAYMIMWSTRAQEPKNVGTHSVILEHVVELSESELQSIQLDEKEYTGETLLLFPWEVNAMVEERKLLPYF